MSIEKVLQRDLRELRKIAKDENSIFLQSLLKSLLKVYSKRFKEASKCFDVNINEKGFILIENETHTENKIVVMNEFEQIKNIINDYEYHKKVSYNSYKDMDKIDLGVMN